MCAVGMKTSLPNQLPPNCQDGPAPTADELVEIITGARRVVGVAFELL